MAPIPYNFETEEFDLVPPSSLSGTVNQSDYELTIKKCNRIWEQYTSSRRKIRTISVSVVIIGLLLGAAAIITLLVLNLTGVVDLGIPVFLIVGFVQVVLHIYGVRMAGRTGAEIQEYLDGEDSFCATYKLRMTILVEVVKNHGAVPMLQITSIGEQPSLYQAHNDSLTKLLLYSNLEGRYRRVEKC
ncbi:hypothetical protein AKO1_012117 [Acrasis kona]|uniref:Photosystem I assembly protein Ycf4 n=1 Tax=Acrasis kona TaxID=1008807 RepID=A0AAW2ZD21_9EUKA